MFVWRFLFLRHCLILENRMTVCMEYPARTSREESEPENAAGRGQEAHAEKRRMQKTEYPLTVGTLLTRLRCIE